MAGSQRYNLGSLDLNKMIVLLIERKLSKMYKYSIRIIININNYPCGIILDNLTLQKAKKVLKSIKSDFPNAGIVRIKLSERGYETDKVQVLKGEKSWVSLSLE